jgi:hypothetical protein
MCEFISSFLLLVFCECGGVFRGVFGFEAVSMVLSWLFWSGWGGRGICVRACAKLGVDALLCPTPALVCGL